MTHPLREANLGRVDHTKAEPTSPGFPDHKEPQPPLQASPYSNGFPKDRTGPELFQSAGSVPFRAAATPYICSGASTPSRSSTRAITDLVEAARQSLKSSSSAGSAPTTRQSR